MTRRPTQRRGVVLVVVTVVILLISLAAFGFLVQMQGENLAARARGDMLQASAVASSGREYLAAILEAARASRPEGGDYRDQPEVFGALLVDGQEDDRDEERQGRCCLLVATTSVDATRPFRFGYENESTKLHLQSLVDWDRRRTGAGRTALMHLPGMDESTADAILDWVDTDEEPREFGAEADYYASLNPSYRPRNACPPTLEELLLVRGVTREKLLGFDVNANFRVDGSEQRLAEDAVDAAASEAAVPWVHLLTVYSGERNESFDGQARIYLNGDELGQLHQQLAVAFEPGWANFIVAYRQYGPFSGSGEAEDASSHTIDLTQPGKRRIRSPLELIGIRVALPDGSESKIILESPFSSDETEMREYLPRLMDAVSVRRSPFMVGRVNINLAPPEVLAGIPGMDSDLVERLIGARTLTAAEDPARRHPVWLLTEGVVDLTRMRQLLPYLTTGGDVGRAQIIGYYDTRSPVVRFETVVDATRTPARQLYYKDLRRLGRGALLDVIDVANMP